MDDRITAGRPINVLIVDDDPDHVFLVTRVLQSDNFNNPINTFRDGNSILQFLKTGLDADRCYCILLDLGLPDMNGTEVLAAIKADPKLRLIPVIILSSHNDPGTVHKCHMLGCSHFISKPVDREKLLAVVRELGYFIRLVEVPLYARKAS